VKPSTRQEWSDHDQSAGNDCPYEKVHPLEGSDGVSHQLRIRVSCDRQSRQLSVQRQADDGMGPFSLVLHDCLYLDQYDQERLGERDQLLHHGGKQG
jgi:hypothetical protein